MSLRSDLETKIDNTIGQEWSYADARIIPETKSIGHGNHGKKLHATVLYADIDELTRLVGNFSAEFSAEIYKSFLYCSSRIITAQGGAIRSFDGDRVMGVFNGDNPNRRATKAALQINWAVLFIVRPRIAKRYPSANYVLRHTCGIDNSEVLVVRGGVRDYNDLAWIGNAANNAAKLNSLPSTHPTWITHRVYEKLSDELKINGNPRRPMWEKRRWTTMEDMQVYCSNWHWSI